MRPPPVALSPALPSELLSYILTHQSYPTTLIICQPRAAFLLSLLRAVSRVQPTQQAPLPPLSHHLERDLEEDVDLDLNEEHDGGVGGKGADAGAGEAKETADRGPKQHHLLLPTLHQIAVSRNINLIYVPSVSHLRAYLSVFHSKDQQEQDKTSPTFTKAGTNVPLVVTYGLIESHRHTSEWSTQGLSLTLSSLVDVGSRTGRKVVLIEELDGEVDCHDEGARRQFMRRVWEERVPILNGSVRRAGFESDEGIWSGRTVEVGRILSRWVEFEKGEWDIQQDSFLQSV